MPKNMRGVAAILLGASVLGLSGSSAFAAAADTPQGRMEAAYAAMGMSEIYRGEGTQNRETVVTLTTSATVQQWDPGQSYAVSDLETPGVGMSTFVERWDRARGNEFRTEWVRPRAGGGTRTYTDIVVGDEGYVIGNDANGAMTRRATMDNPPLHTMSAIRLRTLLREHERTSIVLEMHDNPERLSEYPAQTVGGTQYPAVQYRSDSGTFIVLFDPATNLPAIVRTRDFDYLMGDANFDMALSDWREVNGIKLPHRMTYTLNGAKVFDTTVQSYDLNVNLPADAFRAPPSLRGKGVKPAAAAQVPFQWILRRLASGFFLDSDNLYTDDGGSLQLRDVAPNISLAAGGTHNTLIVATDSYLVAFDAPGDDGQSQQVMALAAQKYPGKPFRYVVLTHHHIDHTGGMRAYAAAGAAIVVGKGNGDFFRKALAAPQETNNHKPAGTIAPNVIEVDGKWSVNDGGRVIEAYVIDNPHAAGYLIPYVPDAKLGYLTDLFNPGGPAPMMANPNMTAVVRGLQRAGVTPDTLAGGHGSVGAYADLARVVQ